jgi:hypothetical protein
MDFPITELMDEQACPAQLVDWLHPEGRAGPRCHRDNRMVIPRRSRDPVPDFRCGHCRRVLGAFTGTARHGNQRRPCELVPILRGFAQGVPTAPGCEQGILVPIRGPVRVEPQRQRVTEAFPWALLGVKSSTICPT